VQQQDQECVCDSNGNVLSQMQQQRAEPHNGKGNQHPGCSLSKIQVVEDKSTEAFEGRDTNLDVTAVFHLFSLHEPQEKTSERQRVSLQKF